MDEVKLFDRELSPLEMAYLGGLDEKTLPKSSFNQFFTAKDKEGIELRNELRELRKEKTSLMGHLQVINLLLL